jgi:hypothetical protein
VLKSDDAKDDKKDAKKGAKGKDEEKSARA